MTAIETEETPERDTRVECLLPGWRFWHSQRWHTLQSIQPGHQLQWVYLVTDEIVGTRHDHTPSYRTFHVRVGTFVAAEAP
jgi:hypothetical protein